MIKEFITEWEEHIVHHFILLNDKIEVIGSTSVEIGSDYKSIYGFYIQEQYRGNGYSKMLMECILLKYNGELHLKVNKNNKRAIKLYEKYNFIFLKQSEDEDFYWMIKN